MRILHVGNEVYNINKTKVSQFEVKIIMIHRIQSYRNSQFENEKILEFEHK